MSFEINISIFRLSNLIGFNIIRLEKQECAILKADQLLLSKIVTTEHENQKMTGHAWVLLDERVLYVKNIEIETGLQRAFKFGVENYNVNLTDWQIEKLLCAPWSLIEDHLKQNPNGSLEKLVEWLSKDCYDTPTGCVVYEDSDLYKRGQIYFPSPYAMFITQKDEKITIDSSGDDEFVRIPISELINDYDF